MSLRQGFQSHSASSASHDENDEEKVEEKQEMLKSNQTCNKKEANFKES